MFASQLLYLAGPLDGRRGQNRYVWSWTLDRPGGWTFLYCHRCTNLCYDKGIVVKSYYFTTVLLSKTLKDLLLNLVLRVYD